MFPYAGYALTQMGTDCNPFPYMLHVRAWYAVTGFLAVLHYWPRNDNTGTTVRIKPLGIPVAILAITQKAQPYFMMILVVASSALAVSQRCANMVGMRALFALAIAGLDLDLYTIRQSHYAFIQLYTSLAMVLPEEYGRGTTLLVILAHQFLSPGLSKMRVGGLKWFSAETLSAYLQEALRSEHSYHPWFYIHARFIHQPWLTRFIVDRRWCCLAFTVLTICFQVVLEPALILLPGLQVYAFVGVGLFVAGLGIVFGFNFAFHLTTAWITLLPSSCSITGFDNAACMMSAVLLAITSAIHLETWPLNCHGLYSYNYEQLQRLLDLSGRFVLCHADRFSANHLQCPLPMKAPCIVRVATAGGYQPAIYHHQLVRQVGGVSFGYEQTPSDEECLERLQRWVHNHDITFLLGQNFEKVDRVRYVDAVDQLDASATF